MSITKTEILSRLETLPEAIRKSEEELLKLKDKSDEKGVLIKQKNQEILRGILNEKEEGKLKFSNEQSRKTALNTRTNNDNVWLGLVKEKKEVGRKISEQIIGLEFLKNKFRAARYMTELIKED